MAVVALNSNLSSLNAQRRLGQSSAELNLSYTRLSSGLRINRASDDAAGLSIASGLNVDERVFAQGVRNANDGISMLNIAEGAVRELSAVLIRLKELASQSANGTLSRVQRLALDEEGRVLVEEFNRIVASTEANTRALFDPNDSSTSIQVGYGSLGQISTELTKGLARLVGDGSLTEGFGSTPAGSTPTGVVLADMDGDGNSDIINTIQAGVQVHFSNGDGTFEAPVFTAAGYNYPTHISVGDFNGDGIPDIITSGGEIEVLLGAADGTFSLQQSIADGAYGGLAVADFNGDGVLDFAVVDYLQDEIRTHLGDGAGNFSYTSSNFAPIVGSSNKVIVSGDINGDGVTDLVVAGGGTGVVSTLIGNGDGTFTNGEQLATGASVGFVELFDHNFDGIADLVARSSSGWSIYRGTTAGVFEEVFSETSTPNNIYAQDLNGDGLADLIVNGVHNGQSGIHTFLHQGDGTFEHRDSLVIGTVVQTAAGDLNGDGVPDIVVGRTSGSSGVIVAINGNENVVTMPRVNLTTQHEARQAFNVIEEGLERVSREISAIGATQSRLSTAVSNLAQSREGYSAAKSRIEDVDVAEESGKLIRSSILQQAGSAVLAQANLLPELVLLLI